MPRNASTRSSRILDLTETIYDAALDPALWPSVLGQIRDAVSGTAVNLRIESLTTGSTRQHWDGFDTAFQNAYAEHYWREDMCQSSWPVGSSATADVLVPASSRAGNGFFNELCVPFGLDDLVGGCVEASSSGTVVLSIMKQRGRRPFDETHTSLLDAIFPHLRRAIRINDTLMSTDRGDPLAWELVERLPVGVFSIGHDGAVRVMNPEAERLLRSELRLERDGFGAASPVATAALRAVIAAASRDDASSADLTVALPRRHAPPLSAVAIPPRRGSARGDVLLVVTDPLVRAEPATSILVRLFGLTAAEARVALLIGNGRAPKEAASELGTSWNTVRAQLRQIYAKTHTTGQQDLVRLLMMLVMGGNA